MLHQLEAEQVVVDEENLGLIWVHSGTFGLPEARSVPPYELISKMLYISFLK
ncbi:hypothetical protein Hsw_PA0142 (plasmid) [Hymenobacter swuensis DY53]|uniref:Uncharacterized protein n=1 Tax=Hymenobacter swuensis DY53 TaxID=1227739 RepID=W8F0X6_9BACT|nr:hypothetical protein Hsw_PA0142 [Hymenobacter swuensis DY53]